MAGVYYLLSQMIIIHGEQYAILKPIMVSIIFIFCDVVSLFVQASGVLLLLFHYDCLKILN